MSTIRNLYEVFLDLEHRPLNMSYGISYRLDIKYLDESDVDDGWFYQLRGARVNAQATGIVGEIGEARILYVGGDKK